MTKQLNLDLSQKASRKRVAPQAARQMIAFLCRGGWHKRYEIMGAYGWKTDRLCRLGCEGSHGRIIFGQDGYKLTKLATLDEIDACSSTILSQIKALQRKYTQVIRRRYAKKIE